MTKDYRPKIVCFSCNFGWGYLGDRTQLAASIKSWVPVACSGKVDATHILTAFREGADGVLILGCPEGGCHFQDGNYQTKKKTLIIKSVLNSFGIEAERLSMHLSVDPEGKKIPEYIDRMGGRISTLGPVKIRKAAMAAQ